MSLAQVEKIPLSEYELKLFQRAKINNIVAIVLTALLCAGLCVFAGTLFPPAQKNLPNLIRFLVIVIALLMIFRFTKDMLSANRILKGGIKIREKLTIESANVAVKLHRSSTGTLFLPPKFFTLKLAIIGFSKRMVLAI